MGAHVNERAIELINAEIDGVLSGAARAELNRLLLADPAIRRLRDDLRRTCQELAALEDEEIPADLHESIMSALPASQIQCEEPAASRGPGRPVLRYAAALAGGLLVSALAFHFNGDGATGIGLQDLAGTIAPARGTAVQVDLPDVKGQVAVTGTATGRVVISRLAATSPVTVIASSEGREVRLEGFVAPQDAPIELSADLGKSRAERPIVVIRVVDAATGAVLQTTSLRPEVPNRE